MSTLKFIHYDVISKSFNFSPSKNKINLIEAWFDMHLNSWRSILSRKYNINLLTLQVRPDENPRDDNG